MESCEICNEKAVARGLCKRHIARFYKWGNPRLISLSNGELYEEIEFGNMILAGKRVTRKALTFRMEKSNL